MRVVCILAELNQVSSYDLLSDVRRRLMLSTFSNDISKTAEPVESILYVAFTSIELKKVVQTDGKVCYHQR